MRRARRKKHSFVLFFRVSSSPEFKFPRLKNSWVQLERQKKAVCENFTDRHITTGANLHGKSIKKISCSGKEKKTFARRNLCKKGKLHELTLLSEWALWMEEGCGCHERPEDAIANARKIPRQRGNARSTDFIIKSKKNNLQSKHDSVIKYIKHFLRLVFFPRLLVSYDLRTHTVLHRSFPSHAKRKKERNPSFNGLKKAESRGFASSSLYGECENRYRRL